MRMHNTLLISILLFAGALHAQWPQPHSGWKLVPGGENLVASGYWEATNNLWSTISMQLQGVVTEANGVLQVPAVNGYTGGQDAIGPFLYTNGDFGVIATIETGPGKGGFLSVYGSLTNGSQYWQGQTRIDYGLDASGSYIYEFWDGNHSSPATYHTLQSNSGSPAPGQITIELLRQNGQLTWYFNGAQFGPIPDPGLSSTNYIMPGFVGLPNLALNISQFAFEVPQSDTGAKLIDQASVLPIARTGDSLASLAAAAGRTFSVAVTAEQLALGRNSVSDTGSNAPDPTLATKAISQFSGIWNGGMYYPLTEPIQGQFVFDEGDAIMATARANGRPVHCHHLIGGTDSSYTPQWVVNGNFTKDQLTAILQNHVKTVVSHYKGQCRSWDVVNEALDDSTGAVKTNNVWAKTIGASYIDLAFQAARAADPQAKLYYNEYNIENQTAKSAGVYQLVMGMKQRGVPIDGVGLQCHWMEPGFAPDYTLMKSTMASLANLGMLARISELDVRIKTPASASDLAAQATYFNDTVRACLDSPNCVEITAFGVNDEISWIPAFFSGYGAATMFTPPFTPKPAYTSVMNTLRTAARATSAITDVSVAWGGTSIAQNTYIVVKGVNLVPATTPAAGVIWSNAPDFAQGKMPTQLNGIGVTVNGKPAFVYYYCSAATNPACNSDQINVLTPLDNTTGTVQVAVTNGSSSTAGFPVSMNAVAPTFLLFNALGPVVGVHTDASLLGSKALYAGYSTPAKPGEIVILFGVGFGLPTTALVNGSAIQQGTLPATPVCTVGGLTAPVASALISPGLYQLNVTVPPDAKSGDNPLLCTYNGASTQAGVFVTVQQ